MGTTSGRGWEAGEGRAGQGPWLLLKQRSLSCVGRSKCAPWKGTSGRWSFTLARSAVLGAVWGEWAGTAGDLLAWGRHRTLRSRGPGHYQDQSWSRRTLGLILEGLEADSSVPLYRQENEAQISERRCAGPYGKSLKHESTPLSLCPVPLVARGQMCLLT